MKKNISCLFLLFTNNPCFFSQLARLFVIKVCLATISYNAALSTASAQTKSLCLQNDEIIFSCTLENKKIVSLCLEKLTDETALPVLVYNYGRPENIEIRYPDHKIPASAAFEYALYFRYQTEYFGINFKNNGYLYSIARSYSGEYNPSQPAITYQLDVTHIATDKEIANHQCKTVYKDSLLTLRDILLRCNNSEAIGCQ